MNNLPESCNNLVLLRNSNLRPRKAIC